MKSNKGITLISLIVYIVVFTMTIATVATISSYFNKNTNEVVISSNSAEQYTKFTTYLTEDLNSINLSTVDVKDGYIDITFVDGLSHKYICNNNQIYFITEKDREINEKVVLCNEIDDCSFVCEENELKISIEIEGRTYNNNYSI